LSWWSPVTTVTRRRSRRRANTAPVFERSSGGRLQLTAKVRLTAGWHISDKEYVRRHDRSSK
jgi:hypothetical protein